MTTTLFREEVVQARSDRVCGDLIISQPIPLRVLIWLIAVIVLIAGLYLALNTYTRKQSVSGWLEPDLGLVEVFPPVPASVSRVFVQQGGLIEKGQVLMSLVPDQRFRNEQAVADSTVGLLTEKLELLDERLTQETTVLDQELARHSQKMKGIGLSLQQGKDTLEAELSILELQLKALERVRQLHNSGSLALASVEEVQLRVLNQRVTVEHQKAAVQTFENTLAESLGERMSLQQASSQRRNSLLQERTELGNRLLQQQASQTIDIVSPVTGTVGRLDVYAGQFVDSRQSVLSMLPEHAVLQARLQVPASAIGFLHEGQAVRFRYSAYAFQKFGVQEGRVLSISSSALATEESSGQPVYQVIASLDSQQMEAYGQSIPLRAGITLSADIVLDERSLLEWLLEPLYSLGKNL